MFSYLLGNSNPSSAANEALIGHEHDNPIHTQQQPTAGATTAVPYLEDKQESIYTDILDPSGIHYSHLNKNEDGKMGASIASCFFTLGNTIMGSGILGLPYAFSKTGWVLGSLLILFSATSSAFALHLLSCCALKLPYPSSFYKVAHTAMPGFEKLIDLAVMTKCFGVATSYLIVIGGLMPDVMDEIYGSNSGNGASVLKSRLLWIVFGFCIVAPLSTFKQLTALKYTSFLSISFICFLMLLVVLYSANVSGLDPCASDDDNSSSMLTSSTDDGTCVGEKANFLFNVDTMKVLSIFVFGFTCHQNMFTIVNEIDAVSKPRCNTVIMAAIGTAFSIYMIIATSGYNTYGDAVESNILQSYPKTPIVALARVFVSLLVCFTYPLQCNPARRCVMTLLSSIYKDHEKTPADAEAAQNIRYMIITAVFLGASFAIALSVEDLGVMLSLVGATGSTLVSYILPGFCYYFLFKDEGPAWKRYVALFQGCLGLIIIPVCLTFIFL